MKKSELRQLVREEVQKLRNIKISPIKGKALISEAGRQTTARFEVSVGALLRRKLRNLLEKEASRRKVKLEIKEKKGLLLSTFYVTLTGDHSQVLAVIKAAKGLAQ